MNIDLFDQFKIECVYGNTNFFDRLLFATLAPIALSLLLALVGWQVKLQPFASRCQNGTDSFEERKAWMFPEETGEMLKYEANHLIEAGDSNGDGKLSYQEMFNAGAYYIGGRLQTPDHEEL